MRSVQMNFLLAYLDAAIKSDEPSIIIDGMSDSTTGSSFSTSDRAALARQIMKEANYYALASNFFWTLWAINMVTSTAIKFGYMVGVERVCRSTPRCCASLGVCSNTSDGLLSHS